jgi:hypothetical protein
MAELGDIISFDTARTVLVPAPLYEKGSGEQYLRFGGMALASDEVAVASEPHDGIVAVMAVGAGEWSLYKDRYERGEVVVTSPLLSVIAGQGGHGAHGGYGGFGVYGGSGRSGRRARGVNILLTAAGNVYLAVWDDGLRMAEVLPDGSTDSILYYMQVVGRRFRLRGFDITVGGERAGLVADALRRYYRKVRVV